jgi:ATPase subunit of ABC transporter with duplicated ATPase domains
MLFNKEVDIQLGNKIIIKNSLINIDKNIKYAIIGPNGIGKTTLMNYLYDNLNKDHNILYITQSENIDDDCDIYEYMIKSNKKLYNLYARYGELNNLMQSEKIELPQDLFEEYNQLCEEINNENFQKYKAKIFKITHGLGFYDLKKKINLLSGGQHTKLSLCKALLLEPELLLLDEPTNHLDLNNVIWLENYLIEYPKGLVIISHNINFFNNIADKIMFFFNIDPYNPYVFTCKGGYDNFKKTFNLKKNEYIKEYDKFCKKIIELKKNKDKGPLEKYIQKTQINKPIRDYNINIKFNQVDSLSSNDYNNIISFNNVNFYYNEDNLILNDINIGISMKSRYILVGNNGSGKSTFFKLCSKDLNPQSGDIYYDHRIRIGYFNQHSINEIEKYRDLNPIQFLQKIDESLDQQKCRAILSQVGFKKMFEGDTFDVSKLLISELSGGQKVKIIMCGIKINNPHIILFDEPTNHLDIYSIDEFIESINIFNGGVVIITHDKYLIENINNYELLILNNKKIIKYKDDFDTYCENILNII